jgi:hypothetical protein
MGSRHHTASSCRAAKSPRQSPEDIYTVLVDHIRVDPEALLVDVATKRPGLLRSRLPTHPRLRDVVRVALSLSDRPDRVPYAVVKLWEHDRVSG